MLKKVKSIFNTKVDYLDYANIKFLNYYFFCLKYN